MWGLSNIREYKSLSSFFVQFLTENFLFQNSFFIQTNLTSFSKSFTMFYENKTRASRILESISPFSFSFIQFFFVQKILSKQTFKNSFSNDASVNNQPCFIK